MTDIVEKLRYTANIRAIHRPDDDPIKLDCLEAAVEIERLRDELNSRCPIDAMDRGMSPVEAAVWHVWGDRCSDFEPECLTCRAWAEFDQIERFRAALGSVSTGKGDPVVVALTALSGDA